MPPQDTSLLHKGVTVFDTVYNPASTDLLTMAQTGRLPRPGLHMLLYQGLASLRLWTGRETTRAIIDLEELQPTAGYKGGAPAMKWRVMTATFRHH